jgi:type I restriction enzyme M protein
MSSKKISLSRLNTFLKLQCDNLRAAGLDASEYKDYIIAMLFLKRVNDQFEIARVVRTNNLLEEYPDLTEDIIADELEEVKAKEYEFFVPMPARWKADESDLKRWAGISTVLENVGDALSIALNALEDANAEILQGILSTTKFNAVNTKGEKIL